MTAASLHILLRTTADPRAALTQAYRALGFAPPTNNAAVVREAVLAQGDEFLSVYDSACTEGDDGTLRRLAASLSAALHTCAIVTIVQDSEDFEFLLFHLGRQVDSAVGDADGHAGGLRTVRGPHQAAIWREALGAARFEGLPHRAGDDPDDPTARFIAIADAAARATQKDAADRLTAWCRLAHLPARAALRGFIDAAASPGNRRLTLARRTTARTAGAQPVLAAHRCDDEYPYHRFFPAAWPTEADAEASFVWPILCRYRGLKNPRIVLHIDQKGGFALRHVGLAAHSAQHGRLVAAAPLASYGQAVPPDAALRASDFAFDMRPFALPEPKPGRHSEFLILLRLDIAAPTSGQALITPTLRADGPDAPPVVLPTLRIAARRVGWTPIVSDPFEENPARRQSVLRLNAPACLTHVAILPECGQDQFDGVRTMIERFVLPMTDTQLVGSIVTQKHPGAETSGHSAHFSVPLATLLQGPLWPRLFQARRDLQSVQVEIGAVGATHGLAGFGIQSSLRDTNCAASSPRAAEGATLAVSLWAIADLAALNLLRLNMISVRAGFVSWVRRAAPLQAWMADCAWIPSFDTYQAATTTLYESAAAVDWVDRGLLGTLCDPAWPRRRLRFAARHLWLGWELASLVDTGRLTSIADIIAFSDGVEVELRRNGDLLKLEQMLAPVLPLHL